MYDFLSLQLKLWWNMVRMTATEDLNKKKNSEAKSLKKRTF